jgi:hypothetical protein
MMRGLQGGIEKYSKIYREEAEKEERKALLLQEGGPIENGPEVEAPEVVANQVP